MVKKGQVSLFMVIGVLILISSLLVVFITMQGGGDGREVLETPIYDPQKLRLYIQTCLDDVTPPLLRQIAHDGGMLNWSENPLVYKGEGYYYVCNHVDGRGCMNKLITRGRMEDELNHFIKKGVEGCLNFTPFEDMGYQVQDKPMNVSTIIGVSEVLVELDYPIRLVKDDIEVSVDDVKGMYSSYLGYLHDVATLALNSEIEDHFFDQDEFMREHGHTWIEKYKPYPDVIYEIQRYDPRTRQYLTYRFAYDGYDTADFVGNPGALSPESPYGYCVTEGNNCYFNSDQAMCEGSLAVDGTYALSPVDCTGSSNISMQTNSSCNGLCKDCGSYSHGESWCVYDGVVGMGYDMPGSRHYKQSCFNGRIMTEPCRDYREEICTENAFEGTAVCRVNRWDDCVFQDSQAECEDDSERDCVWDEDLIHPTIQTYGLKDRDHLCYPEVPPGIKHWKYPINPVCEMASEWRDCDGFECPNLWNDRTSQYCSSQGDCGIGRTITDELSNESYLNFNGYPREGIGYLSPGYAGTQEFRLDLPLEGIEKPVDPTTLSYENPEGDMVGIMQALTDFLDEASTWEACDFCDCIAGVVTGNCVFDEEIRFAEYCSVWQPPYGGDDCSVCNSSFNKECTEYRCKSLGKACIFKMENGTGKCLNPNPGDTQGPGISYSGYPGNYTMENTFDFGGVQGYWICNGDDCSDDMAGSDGLQPYTKLNFTVDLTEDATCRTTPVPVFEYHDIPPFLAGPMNSVYAKNYTYDALVYSTEEITDLISDITGFASLFSIAIVDEIDQAVTDFYTSAKDLADDFGQDTTDLDDAYQQYQDDIITPLYDFYDQFQDTVDEVVTDLSSNYVKVYFKCIDRSGNKQDNEFFIQYTVGPDTKPAELMEAIPHNNTNQERRFNLSVWFDEPVRCRWGETDQPYNQLPNKFDCPTSSINYDLVKEGFRCIDRTDFATLGGKEVHIRCLDQPRTQDAYRINVEESTLFQEETDYPGINLTGTANIFVSEPVQLRQDPAPKIYIKTMTASLELNFTRDYECRYHISPDPVTDEGYNDMANDMSCSANQCSAGFSVTGSKYLHISCVLPRTTLPNEGKYSLSYNII